MSANNKTDTSGKETRKRVFVTHAQVLSDEQRQTLTEEEIAEYKDLTEKLTRYYSKENDSFKNDPILRALLIS